MRSFPVGHKLNIYQFVYSRLENPYPRLALLMPNPTTMNGVGIDRETTRDILFS